MTDVVVVPHAGRPIPPPDVLALYRGQGWWPERTVEQVARVLSTAPAAGAWREDGLVGFARAVTDGVLRAYVEDVVVTAEMRGAGVGRALVSCLLDQLDSIPVVTLFCARDLVPYYEASGFRPTGQVVLHRS